MGTSYRPSASDQKPNCCRVAAKKKSRALGWPAGGKKSDAKSKGWSVVAASRGAWPRAPAGRGRWTPAGPPGARGPVPPGGVPADPPRRSSRRRGRLRAGRLPPDGRPGRVGPGSCRRRCRRPRWDRALATSRPARRWRASPWKTRAPREPRVTNRSFPGTASPPRRGIQTACPLRLSLQKKASHKAERLPGEVKVLARREGGRSARHPVAAGLEVAQERELQRGIGEGHAVDPGLWVFGQGGVLGSQVRLGSPEEAQHLAASFSVVDDLEAGQLVGGDDGSDPLEERLRRRAAPGASAPVAARTSSPRAPRACGREGGVEPRPSRRSRGLPGEVEDVERRPPDDEQAGSH